MSKYIDGQCDVEPGDNGSEPWNSGEEEEEEEEETETETEKVDEGTNEAEPTTAAPSNEDESDTEPPSVDKPNPKKRSRSSQLPADEAPKSSSADEEQPPPTKKRAVEGPPSAYSSVDFVDPSASDDPDRFLSSTADGKYKFVARIKMADLESLQAFAKKMTNVSSEFDGSFADLDIVITIERKSPSHATGGLILSLAPSGGQLEAWVKIHFEPGDEWTWHYANNPPRVIIRAEEFYTNLEFFCKTAISRQGKFFNVVFGQDRVVYATATVTTASGASNEGGRKLGASRADCSQNYHHNDQFLPEGDKEHSFHWSPTVFANTFLPEYLEYDSITFDLLPVTLGFIEVFTKMKHAKSTMTVAASYVRRPGEKNVLDETLSFVFVGGENNMRIHNCKQTHELKRGEPRWDAVDNIVRVMERKRAQAAPRGALSVVAAKPVDANAPFVVTTAMKVGSKVMNSIVSSCQKGIRCSMSLPLIIPVTDLGKEKLNTPLVFRLSGSAVKDASSTLSDELKNALNGGGGGQQQSEENRIEPDVSNLASGGANEDQEEIWNITLLIAAQVDGDGEGNSANAILTQAGYIQSVLPPEDTHIDESGNFIRANPATVSNWTNPE
jgi:hypothetical protein